MKNYVLLLSFIFLVTSCQVQESEKTQVKIGSELLDGNETMTPIVAGDLSTQEVWLKYIDAHNNRDLETIASINHEDWIGYTPDGSVVKGNDTHIEILDNWFKTSNPNWKVKWMIANGVVNNDGEVEQYLTTANDFSDIDSNGTEIKEHNIHDILFVNGKIKKITVYKRAIADETAEFSY